MQAQFLCFWRALSTSSVVSRMAKLAVQVNITSDIVCPWCWVGKKQLDTAMKHLSDDFEFHVRWKPFLLNSFLPEQGIPLADYFNLKYGEEVAARFMSASSPLAMQARALGINFNSDRLVVPTKKPHIIMNFALRHGKENEMQEVLFRAYFSEGRNVSSDDVLKELVSEVGLNPNEALAALSDTKYIHEFEEAIKQTKLKGINSVPFFEFYLRDKPEVKQSFSGAQQVDTMVTVCSRLKSLAKM